MIHAPWIELERSGRADLAAALRAAGRAGLTHVPVVIRDLPADPYAQVAENQKRHGLTPLDLARFIKSRSEAGEPTRRSPSGSA